MKQTKDLNLNVFDGAVNSALNIIDKAVKRRLLEDFLQMAKDMGCDVSNINYPKMPYVEQWCTKNDIYFT